MYKWVEKYVMLSGEDTDYFGEYVTDGGQKLPYGTGVFYHKSNNTYEMYEDYDPETRSANGMFFGHRSKEEYRVGNGDISGDFYAGFLKDGIECGDGLIITTGKEPHVEYSYYDNGNPVGPFITVFQDGSYTVEETVGGSFTGRAYRYAHGRLFVEVYSKNKRTTHCVIKCGRAFEVRETYMRPPYYFGNGNENGFRPAIVTRRRDEDGEDYFEYRGAVQTFGEKQEYMDLPNGQRIFMNQVRNDLGIIPKKNGDKYFGEIAARGKGDYTVTGFGCISHSKDGAKYIGHFSNGKKSGFGLVTDGSISYLGSFADSQLFGGGFSIGNTLCLASYKNGEMQRHYFEIDENFNLTEYEGKKVVQRIIFDDEVRKTPRGVDSSVPDEDKINLNKKETLAGLGLTYEVTSRGEIFLTGVTKKALSYFQELHIPGFVKGVRQGAFRGIKGLRLVEAGEGFEIIEAEAFRDCPDIKELTLPRTLKTIGAHAFTTKKLEKLNLLAGCERLVTQSFRACTGLKKVYIPSATIIENEALPPRFDDMNGENFDEKKIEAKEKREEKRREHNEKIKAKVKRQVEKKQRQKKNFNALPAIGKFFATIGSALLTALLFIPKKIWEFLCFIGSGIGYFFTDTIPDAFHGSLRGLGYFFRRIGEGIVFIVTLPFKAIARFCGSFVDSASGIWSLVGIGLCALTMTLGATGCLYYISEGAADFMSLTVPSVFGFRLLMGAVELFDTLGESPLVILVALLVLLGLVIDLVLNLLWAIIAFILCILYLVFGVAFIYGGGVICAAPAVVGMIIAVNEDDDKGVPALSLIIGIAVCVIYYMFMTVFYGPM